MMMAKLTISKVQKMDTAQIEALTEAELKSAIRSAQKSISQRIRRLKAAGLEYSPAIGYINSVGTPKTRNGDGSEMTENELRNELLKGLAFFQRETSTIAGMREFESYAARGIDMYGQAAVEEWSEETQKRFWSVYNKYMDEHDELRQTAKGSDYVKQALAQIVSYEGFQVDINTMLDTLERAVESLQSGNKYYFEDEGMKYGYGTWWGAASRENAGFASYKISKGSGLGAFFWN